MEKDLSILIGRIRNLEKIAKRELIEVSSKVDLIIDNELKERNYIEYYLDKLLNLNLLGVGIYEFHRLNEFYSAFDARGAEDYKKIYEEMTQEKY